MPKILIIVGSKSDLPKVEKYLSVLEELNLEYQLEVASAHRTPEKVKELAETAREKGFEVIVTGAGLAAALPGVVAAHTTLPVIGVPIAAGALNGIDALYSIVQMPPGIPVGTMGIDNFRNAFIYAAHILSVKYPEIEQSLKKYRENHK